MIHISSKKYAWITEPPLRQKAEDLAWKWVKIIFWQQSTKRWFHRWKKREKISSVKLHEEQVEANHVSTRQWIH